MKTKRAEEREGTASGAAGTGAGAGAGVTTSKPNVFFIMIDDMGWNDIGHQSTDLAGVTPNLDKLAAGGVKVCEQHSSKIIFSVVPHLKRTDAQHLTWCLLLTPSLLFLFLTR